MNRESDKAYRNPLYYEVAFGFVNPSRQVDLYERFIARYSGIPVRRVVELGCGPGLIVREFARRRYRATGLDLSWPMLSRLKRVGRREGNEIETVRADMTDFRLRSKADFAMMLMGTVDHIADRAKMRAHLASVARSLRPGGLYLIENYQLDWDWSSLNGSVSWTMEKDGVRVDTTFTGRVLSKLNQRVKKTLELHVRDKGRRRVLREAWECDVILPREFEDLVNTTRGLEFIGWFERYRLKRLNEVKDDNIALLRHD